MAKDFQAALKRNEDLGLTPDEIAFTMPWRKGLKFSNRWATRR
jgi:hypothetical protein